MFVIPPHPKNAVKSSGDAFSQNDSQNPSEIEIDFEVDLPAETKVSGRSKVAGPLSPRVSSLTVSNAISPTELNSGRGVQTFTSAYRYKPSSYSRKALWMILAIVAGIVLIGGVTVGAVSAIKSFVASMPKLFPVEQFGTEVSVAEAVEATSQWVRFARPAVATPLSDDPTFDDQLLISSALVHVSLSPESRVEAIERLKPLTKSVRAMRSDSTEFEVLDVLIDSNVQTVKVRLYNQTSGEIAYVGARCRRSEDLTVRVCDVDFFDGKGWASDLLKRHLISMPAARQSVLDTFAPADEYVLDGLVEKVASLCELPAKPLPTRIAAYKSLPPRYAGHPAIERIYLASCAEEGSRENFQAAYANFKSRHPADTSMAMLAIEYLPSIGVFTSLDSDIDLLATNVKKDPFLDWYRAIASAASNQQLTTVELLTKVTAQPWAPSMAAGLLEFATNRTGNIREQVLPLIGTQLASIPNLFVKPKSQAEVQQESLEAYSRAQLANQEAERNASEQQKTTLDEYNKMQRENNMTALNEQQRQQQIQADNRRIAGEEYSAKQRELAAQNGIPNAKNGLGGRQPQSPPKRQPVAPSKKRTIE